MRIRSNSSSSRKFAAEKYLLRNAKCVLFALFCSKWCFCMLLRDIDLQINKKRSEFPRDFNSTPRMLERYEKR
jgi:hypothetical protein